MMLLTKPETVRADETFQKVTTVEGITEYRLANGLRVLLFPDASKPIVTVNLTVFVGSRHEGYGETGMAHLLEHMVFKGTPLHPNVPKALRDHGAGNRFNGTTWVDRTNYYETMPSSDENLEFGIRLEADRMMNSFIKREDLASEMTVVRNEFESGENSPERILAQRAMAVAYEWHNYGKSTIGNRSDIEKVPVENLRAFYTKFYQPDNAMLVVAGQFDEKKALQFIGKYFGALKKPERELPNTYTQEPAQDGERNVTLRRVGNVGAVGVVYHIPAGVHPDFAALEVLEDTLTSEPSGRLYKALIESKLATSMRGVAFSWHDPGVIQIGAQCEPDKIEQVRDVLIKVLEGLKDNPITEEEVARSKVRFAKFNEQLTSSSDSLAVQLSEWAGCGDWRLFFIHRDRIEKVTAAEVNKVAGQYLTRTNRTVGVFYPTKEAQRTEIPESPQIAAIVDGYKGKAIIALGEAFDPTPENIEKRLQRGDIAGVKFAFLEKKTRGELVNLQLSLRFGNEKSLTGQTTAVDYVGDLMMRGTKTHNRQQLADELDALGSRVRISTSTGLLTVSIQAKRPNLAKTLVLLQEMLREPTFPAEEFEILRREQLEAYEKAKTEPQQLASQMLRRKLSPYSPDDVRYSPTIEEQIVRNKAVTLEQVKELYAKQIGGEVGELAIVGDFDAEATTTAIAKILAGWKSSVPYTRIERSVFPMAKGVREIIMTPDKANAVYLSGQTFEMTDDNADYPAIVVGNYLLGSAPLASRLSNRVRGKEGLSYGVGSQTGAGTKDKVGQFIIFAITNPKNIEKVDAAVRDELDKFYKEGVSLGELNEGKQAYLQQLKTGRASDASLVSQLATNLFNGRTFAFQADQEKKIDALTPEQIQAAFKKYIPIEKLTVIEAGDFPKK